MEQQNDNAPETQKSYVQEFLEQVKDTDGNYQKLFAEDCIERYMTSTDFQGFCKELEALQNMRDALGDYLKYLETKHEQ
jgi:FPC/CPF motif-containing protein YcgG